MQIEVCRKQIIEPKFSTNRNAGTKSDVSIYYARLQTPKVIKDVRCEPI